MNVTPLEQSVANIGEWAHLPFFMNGGFDRVCANLRMETCPVWPAAGKIFSALQLVQPCDVRVVILGQDPYPQAGRAVGLAFGVPDGQMPEKGSLPNIFDKLRNDPGVPRTTQHDVAENCQLTGWAMQGVLLLNTALTVPENIPGGHRGIGWSPLISQILWKLAPRSDIAWLLCGYRARRRVLRGLSPHALVLRTGHPSRMHQFNLDSPFSRINRFLEVRSIDWWQS